MEPNTKLVVITLVLALTLTAASGQPCLCGMWRLRTHRSSRLISRALAVLPCLRRTYSVSARRKPIPFSVGSTLTSLLNSRTSVVYLRKLAKRGFLLEGCALRFDFLHESIVLVLVSVTVLC
ncbi:hypothetical protein Bca4012_090333 [Brassica carinata]